MATNEVFVWDKAVDQVKDERSEEHPGHRYPHPSVIDRWYEEAEHARGEHHPSPYLECKEPLFFTFS